MIKSRENGKRAGEMGKQRDKEQTKWRSKKSRGNRNVAKTAGQTSTNIRVEKIFGAKCKEIRQKRR